MPKRTILSFVKQPWFIALTAVVGLAGGLVGIANGIKQFRKADPPVRFSQNTEIVFDRSDGMKRVVAAGKTKLDLARDAVDLILRNQILGDNLAFRDFGGSCQEDRTPPTLPFSQENTPRIRQKIQDKAYVPNGKANLIAAVRHAITDFADKERFDGVDKRIIVITGSLDECTDRIADVIPKLNELAEDGNGKRKGIVLDLNFIGIGLDAAAKLEFDGYAERTGGSAHFADTAEEIRNVVEIVEVARVKRSATAVSGILKVSAERLSPVITSIRAKNYAAAEQGLEQVRIEFAGSEVPFQDLVKRQTSDGLSAQLTAHYRRIYQAANKSRDLQSQVISLTETMLSQGKSADERAMSVTIDKYEDVRAAYNKSDDELQALLKQLDALVRVR